MNGLSKNEKKSLNLVGLICKLKEMKNVRLERFNLINLLEVLVLDENWKKALYILLRGNTIRYISRSYVLEKCEDLLSLSLNNKEHEILDFISEKQKEYKKLF